MAVILRTSLSLWVCVGCSFESGVRGWGWYWSVGGEGRSREGRLSLDVSSSWEWSVSECCGNGKEREGKGDGRETYIELVIRVCGPICWVFRLLLLMLR